MSETPSPSPVAAPAPEIPVPVPPAVAAPAAAAPVPKGPPKLLQKRAEDALEAKRAAGARPPGWWSLPDLSGSLAGVTAAINGAADIPEHWKAALVAEINQRCGKDFNFLFLDAHAHIEKDKLVIHIAASLNKALL